MTNVRIRSTAHGRVPRAWTLRVVAVAAAITAIGIAGCVNEADKETINAMVSTTMTFERDTFPFTFEYPDGFELTDDVSASEQLGGGRVADEIVAVVMDEDNGLIIERYTLNVEVSQANLGLAKREVDGLIQQLDPDAAGEEGELAGFPSLTYAAVAVPGLKDGETRIIAFFEGDQEYLIHCQSTPEGREEVEQACDLAVDTLARRS
jgi:hypothetical protein